jgi:protein-tyrosine phosphatase
MSPLRPADIAQREFTTVEHGYDPSHVRVFLSRVARAYEELDVTDPSLRVEDQVAAILAEARTTAVATIDKALDQVAGIRQQTLWTLEDLRWRANHRVSRIRQEAVERCEEILSFAGGPGPSGIDNKHEITHAVERSLASLRSAIESARRIGDELEVMDSVTGSLRNLLGTDGASVNANRIRILIICTWNRCRSPIASEILRREVARLGCRKIDVISRGTDAELGYAPPTEIMNWAGRHGMDMTRHRSRRLGRTDVVLADLVVAMERRHARVVRELYPWAKVVLLGDLPDATIDLAAPPRELFDPLVQQTNKAGGHEIADPRGRSKPAYERCINEMSPHLRDLARILARAELDLDRSATGIPSEEIAKEKGASCR